MLFPCLVVDVAEPVFPTTDVVYPLYPTPTPPRPSTTTTQSPPRPPLCPYANISEWVNLEGGEYYLRLATVPHLNPTNCLFHQQAQDYCIASRANLAGQPGRHISTKCRLGGKYSFSLLGRCGKKPTQNRTTAPAFSTLPNCSGHQATRPPGQPDTRPPGQRVMGAVGSSGKGKVVQYVSEAVGE
jgi:hypothetical protein